MNLNFNQKELQYINAGVEDSSQHVYRKNWGGVEYDVICKLPQGNYLLTFKLKRDAVRAYGDLRVSDVVAAQVNNTVAFELGNTKELSFIVSPGGGSQAIVTSLREQVVNNLHKLQKDNSLSR